MKKKISTTETGSETAKVGEEEKTVAIEIFDGAEEEYDFMPGLDKISSMLETFNTNISFGGNNFEGSAQLDTLTGSRWFADRQNSPEVVYSYGGAVSGSGSLTGRIVHPTFSGEFPPKWAPGDPWAKWEVYAEATIGLAVSMQAQFLNEFSPTKLEIDGSAVASGDLETGILGEAQVLGYTVTGNANAQAGFDYTAYTVGSSPNKRLEGYWHIDPVTLNATLVLRDSDGEEEVDKEFSQTIWEGWTQSPATVLLGPDNNPS